MQTKVWPIHLLFAFFDVPDDDDEPLFFYAHFFLVLIVIIAIE